MRTIYKSPLSTDKQVEYLQSNKKVVFNTVSKPEAKKILYFCNYINVVSPYKHIFAKTDPISGETIRDAHHNHIYERNVEFSEYVEHYKNERNKYPTIYKNIMEFESSLNSIVSYEVINGYNIVTYKDFIKFRDDLLLRASSISSNQETVIHLQDEINSFYNYMKHYEDIYIFMDRLSLSAIIAIWRCSKPYIRNRIFNSLLNSNKTFGYTSFGTFTDFLVRIVPIRNCVCHFNSLEILTNYYDIKKHSIRKYTDRKKYINIIKKLSS